MAKKKAKRIIARLDRRAVAVTTFSELDNFDREYWKRQTPQARLRALEMMRQIKYGKAALEPIKMVFEIATFKSPAPASP